MASSSSSPPLTWTYRVFTSFHGPDVRKTFLSHLRKQFNYNGISMFDDQGIERGQTIAPKLTQAIRESRISIVVLSKKYASSSWCLDELLEITKCKEEMGQTVMTVFYGVDPSDVRKQTGDFGKVFNETCAEKTEEKRRMWSQALEHVGNIAGEHFLNWDNEAEMIEKITRDVSDKLNATPSRDFDSMVGLEPHLREMDSLLDFDYDGVKMVAISGPAGIGKTTIARALHSRLSNRFQLTCFVDNLRVSYPTGLHEYGLKLHSQEQFLSKILNQNGIRTCHLGAIKERLHDQRVLIILDDVDDLNQLEALANETTWFGPGSRIVVTTENKELLQQHGINNTYHVRFPSGGEALEILCRYAFRQNYPPSDFKEFAGIVTELCGNLPLGLRVVGSTLRGKNEEEWEQVIHRLETILDHRDIEEVLRVSYESLHEKEQSLFLHIAVFFNCYDGDLVKAIFADNNLDVKYGLKILANKSLIDVTKRKIKIHKLLQQVGTKIVQQEKPWKRRILTDPQVICDVLEHAKGTREVSGISFDISDIDEISISNKAFKRMPNLRFLKVYKRKDDGNDVLHIPEETEFPRHLKLLHWEAYPSKSLSLRICLENLVELNMKESLLEKLWEGTQQLTNLKKMDLSGSLNLKELPDLSNAAMLEHLEVLGCKSLVEIHSSIGNLHKIGFLDMSDCTKLQVVPARFNLGPLGFLGMTGCSQLRNFPDISSNITYLHIPDTMLVEELPKSVRRWSALRFLTIFGVRSMIERIPDCIKDFHELESLWVIACSKLESLPELPRSLKVLVAEFCESLKTVSLAFDPKLVCIFPNCFNLDGEARRVIQQSLKACLPGRTVPAEFDHRALGNSLTIRSDFTKFRICVVVFPKQENKQYFLMNLWCRVRINKGCLTECDISVCSRQTPVQGEHLCFSYTDFVGLDGWLEQDNEIMLEFMTCQESEIIECGVQIMTEESERRRRVEFDEAYSTKSLPLNLYLENLVELNMKESLLEKLWEGTQQLTNLKKMDLSGSLNLKELPDLSSAVMLEHLEVRGCESLVEIHSSIGNLHKICFLDMSFCTKLQVVPARFNLGPHAFLSMMGCSQLRNFPDISSNITRLLIADTMLEELPKSVRRWSALQFLTICGDRAKIERIPDCIKDFHELGTLWMIGCSKLASLPELPVSLKVLKVGSCESLKTVSLAFDPELVCVFTNCFNLDGEARRVIQQSLKACLPGREVPADFDHRALGNSLTIRSDFTKFRICVVVSPKQEFREHFLKNMWCRVRINKGCLTECDIFEHLHNFLVQAEHLCFSYTDFVGLDGWLEQDNEITLEFITCQGFKIIECGVQIMTEDSERRRSVEFDGGAENRTDRWSWLHLSSLVRSTANLFRGGRR